MLNVLVLAFLLKSREIFRMIKGNNLDMLFQMVRLRPGVEPSYGTTTSLGVYRNKIILAAAIAACAMMLFVGCDPMAGCDNMMVFKIPANMQSQYITPTRKG
mmetsp:Transcript_29622/g.56086  ORF Transcript_29622/g.56086 Transcript_29622/m.56086 type:complete len:102 (-) Transcript_29622:1680-1985(-)